MAERTFHQVITIYGVPKDPPPLGLSFETIVLDNPAYVTGSFDAHMDTNRDLLLGLQSLLQGLSLEMSL